MPQANPLSVCHCELSLRTPNYSLNVVQWQQLTSAALWLWVKVRYFWLINKEYGLNGISLQKLNNCSIESIWCDLLCQWHDHFFLFSYFPLPLWNEVPPVHAFLTVSLPSRIKDPWRCNQRKRTREPARDIEIHFTAITRLLLHLGNRNGGVASCTERSIAPQRSLLSVLPKHK